jgi:ABC-type nitrate/sulfonate/bicarbonate transport system substrate-binding protein
MALSSRRLRSDARADAAAQEKTQDKVTFALNWIPSGNHFGVFAAKDRDLYRDANVDVDIQRGYGSGDTLKRVATGNGDIGISADSLQSSDSANRRGVYMDSPRESRATAKSTIPDPRQAGTAAQSHGSAPVAT